MILATGGAGFIASGIARALSARGVAAFGDPTAFAEQHQEVHDLCIHVLAEALEPRPVRGQAP